MKIKINWKEPKNELDNVILTMLFYYDIWKNKYQFKHGSKYYKYVSCMSYACPLCNYYIRQVTFSMFKCNLCFLPKCQSEKDENPYDKWLKGDIEGAKEIYLLCKQKAKELINEIKYNIEGS